MKRHILLAAAILGVAVSAAAITISAPQKIEAPEGSHHPVLSPDGKTLLFSTQDHTGLKAMDLTTGGIATIDTDAAAGFAPIFNADGTKVFYRTAMLVDGLLCHDVRSYDIAKDAKPVKLQSYSRKTPSNLNTVSANDNYAFADYRDILVCHNGVTTKIAPLSDAHSYLWASLSPDGTHLLFCEPFEGVFVANADGTQPQRIASKGDFPAWLSNNMVAYVVTHDDGYVVLDSKLRVVNIASSQTTDVTNADTLVGEAAAAAGKIVYSDLQGNMYLIHVSE